MNIIVKRKHFLPNCTIGTLEVCYEDNPLQCVYVCDTLEPTFRDLQKVKKVKGKTAIPCGEYDVRYRMSMKFNQNMPYLEDVPNFKGIMIHTGNNPKDTQGCILVGVNPRGSNGIVMPRLVSSRDSFNRINELIYKAIKSEEGVKVIIMNV